MHGVQCEEQGCDREASSRRRVAVCAAVAAQDCQHRRRQAVQGQAEQVEAGGAAVAGGVGQPGEEQVIEQVMTIITGAF